jgi:hypothetical protein
MADTLELVPLKDLQPIGDAWIATGDDPHFLLRPHSGRQPGGWTLLRFKMESGAAQLSPVLYVDEGTGFSEMGARRISVYEAAGRGVLLRLPNKVEALRLDPLSGRGQFQIDGVWIEQIGRARAVLMRMARIASRLARNPGMARRYVVTAVRIARQSGPRGLLQLRERQALDGIYADWILAYDTLNANDCAAIAARIAAIDERPMISIVVPLYNTPERLLRRCIDSVRAQLWPHWELCLADDASTTPHVRTICEEYARHDKRICFVRRKEHGHIAAASNTALSAAGGDFVALLYMKTSSRLMRSTWWRRR